jgi:putative Ca2+/H+ antiporter (TMEM165/GDT1 family)
MFWGGAFSVGPKLRYFARIRRDYYAGALMILVGLVAAQDARHYAIGTLRQMGPGYFPLALGVVLIVLGLLIAGTAATGELTAEEAAMPRSEWRGWGCILAGPVLFIIFGEIGGMLPATFACVFVAALGDRETSVKGAAILATGVTVFAVVLFHSLLKLPMPVVRGTWL